LTFQTVNCALSHLLFAGPNSIVGACVIETMADRPKALDADNPNQIRKDLKVVNDTRLAQRTQVAETGRQEEGRKSFSAQSENLTESVPPE